MKTNRKTQEGQKFKRKITTSLKYLTQRIIHYYLLELKYYNRNRLLFLAATYNNTYNMTSHYSKHSQTF